MATLRLVSQSYQTRSRELNPVLHNIAKFSFKREPLVYLIDYVYALTVKNVRISVNPHS